MDFLFSAEVKNLLLIPKMLFFVIAIIFIGAIVYFIRDSGYFKIRWWQDVIEIFTARSYGVSRIVKKWERLKKRLELNQESEYKLSIIEADELLNEILGKMGYRGETLGDKLMHITPSQLRNVEHIKDVNKIRNNIVHDPDYLLSLEQAQRALEAYEEVLRELQAL